MTPQFQTEPSQMEDQLGKMVVGVSGVVDGEEGEGRYPVATTNADATNMNATRASLIQPRMFWMRIPVRRKHPWMTVMVSISPTASTRTSSRWSAGFFPAAKRVYSP